MNMASCCGSQAFERTRPCGNPHCRAPRLEFLIWYNWDGVQEFACLKNHQVTLTVLVQELHFENHCFIHILIQNKTNRAQQGAQWISPTANL